MVDSSKHPVPFSSTAEYGTRQDKARDNHRCERNTSSQLHHNYYYCYQVALALRKQSQKEGAQVKEDLLLHKNVTDAQGLTTSLFITRFQSRISSLNKSKARNNAV